MKKRPKVRENRLEKICKEIIEDNRKKWKKRKVLEGEKKRIQEEKYRRDWEEYHCLERARKKKEELLHRIEKIVLNIGEKNLTWIKQNQKLWREYRDRERIDRGDEEKLMKKLRDKVPIRESRIERGTEKSETTIGCEKVKSGKRDTGVKEGAEESSWRLKKME